MLKALEFAQFQLAVSTLKSALFKFECQQANLVETISNGQGQLRLRRPLQALLQQTCCDVGCENKVAAIGAACPHGYCEAHRSMPYHFVRHRRLPHDIAVH